MSVLANFRPNVHDALFLVQFRIWKKFRGLLFVQLLRKRCAVIAKDPFLIDVTNRSRKGSFLCRKSSSDEI
ncbi:hypothetical protein Y032_0016g2981 [Ancylostoma ceylanicum]|uniref:Uncharacterized protein n=1 Tax=Ancylostoma ceylanicum TaxID=53326 RepID=A0A016V6D7_9BILA|nr:hypothetical protein Y032_0016g2981 [Ancylostoma ceylanicum]